VIGGRTVCDWGAHGARLEPQGAPKTKIPEKTCVWILFQTLFPKSFGIFVVLEKCAREQFSPKNATVVVFGKVFWGTLFQKQQIFSFFGNV